MKQHVPLFYVFVSFQSIILQIHLAKLRKKAYPHQQLSPFTNVGDKRKSMFIKIKHMLIILLMKVLLNIITILEENQLKYT